jgi:hypothetical protein
MIGNLEDGDDKKKTKLVVAPKATPSNNLSSKEIEALKNILERFPQLEDTQ